MSALRVGLVGARRRRQGLGPFVARDLVAAGAEVPCFVATSEATLRSALPALREYAGISPRGYLDLRAMLEAESLDALAILSPPEFHARHLEIAAEAGLHVLCEKPFVWDDPDPLGRCRALLEAFTSQRLLVWENCQWPYTLTGFEALHPGGLAHPPRHFEMELAPISSGRKMLGDALPHPISLLQTLCPGGSARAEAVQVHRETSDASALTLRFQYRTDAHSCEVEIRLERSEAPPRRAAYAIDGQRARRVVSPQGYQLSFADSDRSVPIADPLAQLVADFVAALRSAGHDGAMARAHQIQERQHLLIALVNAYEETL